MKFKAVLCVAGWALLGTGVMQVSGQEAEWTRCDHARYKAYQFDESVVLVAFGTHPTAGFQAKFRQLPIEIYPPQFEFVEQKPDGIVAQVITPFAEVAHFQASDKIKSVVVQDAKGKQTIDVVQEDTEDPADDEMGYLTPDGKLITSLVLQEAQSGFAGVNGTRWTIAPDGSWTKQALVIQSNCSPLLKSFPFIAISLPDHFFASLFVC